MVKLTNVKTVKELLKSHNKISIPLVITQINLPQKRRTVHANFHVHFQPTEAALPPVRPHRRPPHHLILISRFRLLAGNIQKRSFPPILLRFTAAGKPQPQLGFESQTTLVHFQNFCLCR